MSKTKLPINPLCGSRIVELCIALGLSQKEFAKEIGVSAQTISRIVSGHLGLSDRVIIKILARYPRVSAKWLRGNPDAKINFNARVYANEKEALEKRHALENVLNIIGVKISPPYNMDGFDDYFYDIIASDSALVAVSRTQMNATVDTIIDIINSYMQGIIKNGMTAEEIMDCASDYATSRLNEICADISENEAKSDDEKALVDVLTRKADVAMHRRNDALKHPLNSDEAETEDELKKRLFEESQSLIFRRTNKKGE